MGKSKFRMPTAYTILFLLILVVAAATWVIPAGSYDYVDGILSAGDYIELKTRFDTAYQEQSSRLNQLSVELARLNRMLSDENKWLVNIRNIRKARKLTPEIAQAMIDHINVYKTGYAQHRLEIIFRFQEERDVLEAVYHEMEGGEPQ